MINNPVICGIHLPIITPDMLDDFGEPCLLIQQNVDNKPQWRQEAVDFANMLARHVPSLLELKAENERLRKALQKIITDGDFTAPEGMKSIARDALGSSGSAPEEQERICRWKTPVKGKTFDYETQCNSYYDEELLRNYCPGCGGKIEVVT